MGVLSRRPARLLGSCAAILVAVAPSACSSAPPPASGPTGGCPPCKDCQCDHCKGKPTVCECHGAPKRSGAATGDGKEDENKPKKEDSK